MPDRIGPKRVRSLTIEDFSVADRHLLKQAFLSYVPMVLVGGLETERPHVISMGHPDGLADPKNIPDGPRYYSITRIKGKDENDHRTAACEGAGKLPPGSPGCR